MTVTEYKELPADFDPFAGPAIAATVPSSDAQREIWTATLIGVDASLAYNESVSLIVRGDVDMPALRAAFDDVVARHEALRTTLSSDGLTLCISADRRDPPQPIDLSTLDEASRAATLRELLDQEASTPFDLESGPLYRVCFLRMHAREVRAVLTAHHIVVDGWSTAVIVKDWASFYNARCRGIEAKLAPPPTLRSYNSQLLEAAQAAGHALHERYWIERFAGELPVLDLPGDRPRPALKSFASARFDAQLDAQLLAALKTLGARQRSSLFIVLLAAFKALLFRLSGQEDLVIGVPAAGQSSPGFEQLVGHCVNMLPMRTRLASEQPFAELIAAVRGTVLDGFEHKDYTFGSLLSKLPSRRDVSRSPLVSVVFNVDRGLTSEAIGFSGLSAECSTNPRVRENFELFLNVVELPSGLTLEYQYNTDLFDSATIARWHAAYERILRAVVDDAALPILRLPVVSPHELELYAQWNAATRADHGSPQLAHELFEASVARAPEAIACVFEGESITYGALNARANQLARRLQRAGVGRDALVGLCVERSIDMLVGVLGVLKAGAAYVPLDPGYPRDRLSYMAADARMAALVTQQRPAAELQLTAAVTIFLDSDAAELAAESCDNLERSASADSPAYVIYTSGSTGKPKGVVVGHRSLVNLLQSVAKVPGMRSSDVVLAVTTLAFDIAVSELILPLTVGAKIMLVSRDVASDGAQLLAVVQQHGVTFIDATPATYRLLLGAGFAGDPNITAICTGEAMPRDLALELVDKVAALWNGYGPTETTVWSSFYRVRKPVERILIGRPIDNTQIHILDSVGQPTPLGVPGEIFIAGDGLALGYLNRPELTAERFVPDFSREPGRRMYRTGDLGRYLPSGEIECLGRNDNQVKLRGYRIELGEIESALAQHAAVSQAALLVREDRPGDPRLVAYLTLQPAAAGLTGLERELRAHLKQTLPDYMLPAVYVTLPQMPLTPSGKVDRRALPAPAHDQHVSQAEFVAPQTETQRLLAALWQTALNVPRVSIHDDFFAIGGHSLLASQVLSRLRRDHGIQLSFRKLFEAPTIAQLAVVVDALAQADTSATTRPLERQSHLGPAPLSVAQERLWLLEQMDPTQELVHNLPAAWRLDGPIELELLQRALDEVVRRHETLRTTFVWQERRVVQQVAATGKLPIELIDLSEHPDPEHQLRVLIDRYTRERFDLARGPLFRSYLFRLASTQHVYFSVRHNIIWDGWSFDVFLRELTTLYSALSTGTTPALPELPITYSDYVRWHHQFLEGPEIAQQIAWWREQLSGTLPDLVLPSDRPRPARSEHLGDNASISLTRADADALTALAHKSGATLFMVLFAAYNVMLHRYSGQSTLLVGTPVRARNRPEAEHLIGPFVNAVVLRTELSSELRFDELLAHVRATTLDAFSHEDMPLERLGSRPPMVRAFFSFQDARSRPPALGEAQISQIHVEPQAAANDLMMWTMETPRELLAVMNYSAELFDPATIQRFLAGFRNLLRGIVQTPDARIADLPISADGDAELLQRWGTPAAPQVLGLGLSSTLQRVAAEAPDRVAVSDGGRTVSYADLVARAQALASVISTKAPQAARLAVLATSSIERSIALIAADLCGASVLLLDPEHPATRMQAICDTLQPHALLASEHPPLLAALPLIRWDDALAASEPDHDAARSDAAAVSSPRLARKLDDMPLTAAPTWTNGARATAELQHAAVPFEAPNEAPSTRPTEGLPLPAATTELRHVAVASDAPLLWVARVDGAARVQLFPVSRVALASGVGALLQALPVQRGQTALSLCAVSGELAAYEWALPLMAGATLVQPEPNARIDRLREHARFDFVLGPASALARLSAREHALCDAYVLTSEADAALATLLLKQGKQLYRMAGFPEAGLAPFAQPITQAHEASRLGRALYPTHAVVQDAQSRPAPVGVPGTLLLANQLNGRELVQAERRARFMHDGTLELAPDTTQHVDAAGVRVALQEVASVLKTHPSILDARVLATRTRSGLAQIEALVALRPDAPFTETELRRHLQQSLPEYALPFAYIEVDKPEDLDDLHKLQSRRSASTAQDDYVAPRTPTEHLLVEHWRKALQLDRVGVHDNFFALGGHSLLCFEVIAAIEKRSGRRLSPRIMLLGTLAQVAVELDKSDAPVPAPQPAAPQPAQSDPALAERLLRRLKRFVR